MTKDRGPRTFSEDTLGVVGVGLIGGSIAAALRSRGFRGRVVGVGRSLQRLQAARDRGLIDEATTDLAETARRCRFLVFCTPVDRIVAGVRAAAAHAQPGTLCTDAGSVKGPICEALSCGLPPGITFIGSHPLAGSEQQGCEHADASLFAGRVCVVTPTETTPAHELERLRAFWEFLGARVIELAAEQHDRLVAVTSHLPHVAAAAVARVLPEEGRGLTATGFRDTTRIASGDPALWTGILLHNAEPVLAALSALADCLEEFRRALASRDAAALESALRIAKTNRDALNRAE